MALQDYARVYRDKGRDAWKKLSARQKVLFTLLGAGVVALFFVMILSFGAGSGGMVPINQYGGDPRAAVAKLVVWGIKAQHDVTNGEILVPKEQEQRAAVILVTSGLFPNGRTAYSFLNESNLTQTDQRTRLQFITTLQDVLAQTISASPLINQATVNLTEHGKPWEFRHPQKFLDAKASIAVETADGGRLTPSQQMAISGLVTGAFTGLKIENITLTDQFLNFYKPMDERAIQNFTVDEKRLSMNREAERGIETALAHMNATATVSIAVRPIFRNTHSRTPNPDTKLVASERANATSREGNTKVGTAGIEGEVGREPFHDPGRGNMFEKAETEDISRNFDYGTTEVTEREDDIRMIHAESTATVTVRLDGALDEAAEQKVKMAASRATSIPASNIEVVVAPPVQVLAGVGGSAAMLEWFQGEAGMKVILLIILLGSVIALMVMLKKSAPKPLTLVDETIDDEEADDIPEIPGLPPVDQLHGNLVREKVVELVRKNPKAAANLVKRWIIFGK